MGQRGFCEHEKRIHKLQHKKPALTLLSGTIPWERFRPLVEQWYIHEHKSNAGSKRIDPLHPSRCWFCNNNVGRSIEEFFGRGVMNIVPDAATIAFARVRGRHGPAPLGRRPFGERVPMGVPRVGRPFPRRPRSPANALRG